MPLYIKLDIDEDGLIGAWINSRKDDPFAGFREAEGKSVGQVLRNLAKQIPKPRIKNENQA